MSRSAAMSSWPPIVQYQLCLENMTSTWSRVQGHLVPAHPVPARLTFPPGQQAPKPRPPAMCLPSYCLPDHRLPLNRFLSWRSSAWKAPSLLSSGVRNRVQGQLTLEIWLSFSQTSVNDPPFTLSHPVCLWDAASSQVFIKVIDLLS
jgi:hypothetical protein